MLSGAQHAGEHLLGVGAASRTIPAADLSVDDGRTQGVLGAPIGGVDGGVEEKAEERRQLGAQMGGESLHVGDGTDVVQRREQVSQHMTTGHGGEMTPATRRSRMPSACCKVIVTRAANGARGWSRAKSRARRNRWARQV